MVFLRAQASVDFLLVLSISVVLLSAGLQALTLVKNTAEKAFATANARQLAEYLNYACERSLFTGLPVRFHTTSISSFKVSAQNGFLTFSFKEGPASVRSLCSFKGEFSGSGVFEAKPAGQEALVVFHPD